MDRGDEKDIGDESGSTDEPTRQDRLDRATLGYDEEPGARREVQTEIQDVLDQLQREMARSSVDDVAAAINSRLADAGIPEQPHRWVEVMAERIAAGLPPVADTRAAVDALLRAESGMDTSQP
jgi:hypothetical protein